MKKNVVIAAILSLLSCLAALLPAPASAGAVIPKAGWTLVYADSEETVRAPFYADNFLDNNASTFWHTQWYPTSPAYPHEIRIDLGGTYTIDGFRYLPRQDGQTNGTVAQYEFYVSADGVNWGTPAASGTFAAGSAEKTVAFASARTGRHIRFRGLRDVNGSPYMSGAEITVTGSGTAYNRAPVVSAGTNQIVTLPSSARLSGSVSDDGLPAGSTLAVAWAKASGPGTVVFTPANAAVSTATFSQAGTYVLTLSASDSALTGSASVTVTVNPAPSTSVSIVPRTGWKLTYVDSQETVRGARGAVYAFDGNASTFWHTQWYPTSPAYPHEIRIDMGASYVVSGFRYLPRQDGQTNGTVAQYEFYVSADGVNWGTPAASGTFAAGSAEKTVTFASSRTGRHIRFRGLRDVNGSPYMSAAEITALGTAAPGVPAPAPRILSWTPPSAYTDGTALSPADLSGYDIYVKAGGSFTTADVPVATVAAVDTATGQPVTSFDLSKLGNLTRGVVYTVSMQATSRGGIDSDFAVSTTFTY